MLINITGGSDMTLFEVDEAANRVRSEVDPDAYIIFGSTFDDTMEGQMRVSVVATGMDSATAAHPIPSKLNLVSSVGGTKVSHPGVPVDDDPANESLETGDDLDLDTAAAFQVTAADGSDIDEGRRDLPAAATASPLAHTPDVFIPPMPVTRSGVETRSAPDPFKDAAMKNGIRPSEGETARAKPRVSSLFARVTGAGRVSRAAKPEAGSQPAAERPVAPPKQPRLGGLNPEERLPASQSEEEVLDIPAFLRRQAN
jgi:cell division protein FtsZ